MGGSSTSNSAVLVNGNPRKGSFDLRSWQGLTEVLRVGKQHLIDPALYAEFRNLVLEYAQKGGDETTRKKIDATISSFYVDEQKPNDAPQKDTIIEQDVPVISHIHDDLSLDVPHIEIQPTQEETPLTTPPTPTPVTIGRSRIVPEFLPKSIQKNDVSIFTDNAPDTIEEQLVPKLPEIPATDFSPSHRDIPPYKTLDEYKARIAEIKRSIHDRIGNPATLIDTHNEVGKKYMSALLSALKATAPGSELSIQSAMNELEDAYETLLNHPTDSIKPNFTPPSGTAETPTDYFNEDASPSHEKNDEPITTILPNPETSYPPIPPEHSPADIMRSFESETDTLDTITQTPPEDRDEVSHTLEESFVFDTKPQPAPPTPETVPPPILGSDIHDIFDALDDEPSSPIPPKPQHARNIPRTPQSAFDVVTHDITPTELPSPEKAQAQVHTENIIKNNVTLPIPQKSTNAVTQSELVAPEVTSALHSLLQEWPLFSGSGIFGIGPNGHEHPLFKKLSHLSMGEVLSGRWEKADAKTLKILKEYVDAWRHEQAIAYTVNETFEHYLRRVVQRILKRKQQS